MAALTAVTPTRVGAVNAGAAVAASDTISATIIGVRGAHLEVINAGVGVDTMTISDAGATPAGTAPGTYPGSVTNATSKIFYLSPSQVDPVTKVVTVTHSQPTGVTYKLYPIG